MRGGAAACFLLHRRLLTCLVSDVSLLPPWLTPPFSMPHLAPPHSLPRSPQPVCTPGTQSCTSLSFLRYSGFRQASVPTGQPVNKPDKMTRSAGEDRIIMLTDMQAEERETGPSWHI